MINYCNHYIVLVHPLYSDKIDSHLALGAQRPAVAIQSNTMRLIPCRFHILIILGSCYIYIMYMSWVFLKIGAPQNHWFPTLKMTNVG
jgi:hypothetical protein